VFAKGGAGVASGQFQLCAEDTSSRCVAPRCSSPNLDALATSVCAVEKAPKIRRPKRENSFAGKSQETPAHRDRTSLGEEELRELLVGQVASDGKNCDELTVAIGQPRSGWGLVCASAIGFRGTLIARRCLYRFIGLTAHLF